MKASNHPIQVSQMFDCSIEVVWMAITQHQQMVQWYFQEIPDFNAEIGFKTQFTIENDGSQFTHLWKVIDVVNFKNITYNWQYQNYLGDSNVVFELSSVNDKTLLEVSCHILEDFTGDVPEFTAESCQSGWQYFIQQSLKNYLKEKCK